MIVKISEKEKVSTFGTVITSVGILISLVGTASAIALIIIQTRPATAYSHPNYGYAGVLLLATCIMLMVTCVFLWEYITDKKLVGIEKIMESLCYLLGGFRIVFYTIFLTNSLWFMDHGFNQTQILFGKCLELAFAAFWILYGIRRMNTSFIEAYIFYHLFIMIVIIFVIVVFVLIKYGNFILHF